MGNLMPSSYADSFTHIVRMIIESSPKAVIDIGPGWGKYGLACREYLPGLRALHAVEVLEGRMSTQDAIYDWVYTGDARGHAYRHDFWGRWELALLIDVIEHMPLEDGHELLRNILGAGTAVIVATPKVFFEQHVEHNPHEEHVSLWGSEEFGPYEVADDYSTVDAIIYRLAPCHP